MRGIKLPPPMCCTAPSGTAVRVHAAHLTFHVILSEGIHSKAFPPPTINRIQKSQGKSHGQSLAISLRFRQDTGSKFVIKFVADAPDGQNVFRCIGIGFDLLAEFSDEGHDIADIQQVIPLPHCLIDLLFGKYLPAVTGQKVKNVKLLWGQRDLLSVPDHSAQPQVDGQRAAAYARS